MNGQTLTLGKTAKAKTKIKIKSKKSNSVGFLNQTLNQKILTKVLVTVLIFALIALGFVGFARAYENKIYPKIAIAGIKIGGLDKQEAKALLDAKVQTINSENGPTITYNDQTVNPKLDELGLTFNTEELVQNASNFGRQGGLKQRIAENFQLLRSGYRMELKPEINQEKFDGYLSQLAAVIEKEPVNAGLKIQNGQIVVSDPENGRGLNKNKLKEDLTALINSDNTNGQIVTQTSELKPEINLEGTTAARAQAEKYLAAAPITVTFENSPWTAGRAEIGTWIKFNESGDKLVASANPNAFINWITDQVDIPAKDREVEDGTGTVLNDGQDGRATDTQTLAAQINDALAKSQPGTFALGTFAVLRGQKTIYPHAQPGRYAGRYIDINLSEQTLYAYEGSTLVNQFLVSTGKSGYSTPTGEFHVYGKDASALMDGPDYYLPNVPFISWFSGDYSIHGTYWHSNFGHVMSHGCVNASIPDAEWLFGWDDIGTPVYIHY